MIGALARSLLTSAVQDWSSLWESGTLLTSNQKLNPDPCFDFTPIRSIATVKFIPEMFNYRQQVSASMTANGMGLHTLLGKEIPCLFHVLESDLPQGVLLF